MDIDLKQLRELMRAMKQLDCNELEIEQAEQRIYLRRGNDSAATAAGGGTSALGPVTLPPPPGLPSTLEVPARRGEEDDANVVYITSPFVGTFYRSPSPDSPSFVEVGQRITTGQVLCIVEAMKLMNEIEAEISGVVLEVLADNGKPVEFGDRLFKVKTA